MNCKYEKCQEPTAWHFLLGIPISPADWHEITEGRFRPSEIWPQLADWVEANSRTVLDEVRVSV